MPSKKKGTKVKKTVTNSNKNKTSQKVVVNVNSPSASTSRKGVQNFTKGLSYLGKPTPRSANLPNNTTVINNMPPMPMFPQMDTNRMQALENSFNNLQVDIQGLYGKLNKPSKQETKDAIPYIDDAISQSFISNPTFVEEPQSPMSFQSSNGKGLLKSSKSSTPHSTAMLGDSSSSSSGGDSPFLPYPTASMRDAPTYGNEYGEPSVAMSQNSRTRLREVLSDTHDSDYESLASNGSTLRSLNALHNPAYTPSQLSRVSNQASGSTTLKPISIKPDPSIKTDPSVKDEVKSEGVSPPSGGDGGGESAGSVNDANLIELPAYYDAYFTTLPSGQFECHMCGKNVKGKKSHLEKGHNINLNLPKGRPKKQT